MSSELMFDEYVLGPRLDRYAVRIWDTDELEDYCEQTGIGFRSYVNPPDGWLGDVCYRGDIIWQIICKGDYIIESSDGIPIAHMSEDEINKVYTPFPVGN